MQRRMRAVRITRPGGPEVLRVETAPAPALGPDEVRVAVRAAGVNRADVLQRLGRYPAPPGVVADVPGLEFAGEVIECGPRAAGWAPGDRVMGLLGGGGYAEEAAVHARALLPVPPGLDFAHAAAIPEAFVTAFDALVLQGGLVPGERVLIHAAGSGVGTAAAQIVAARGATAIGTSRTPDKLDAAAKLGLSRGIVPEDGRFAAAVNADGPVDLVLDLVGGPYTAESVRCLADRGRLLLVGLLAGLECAMPLATVLGRRIRVQGTVLRARPIEEKIAVMRAFAKQCGPWLADGTLAPVLAGTYPMAEAAAAHRRMQSDDVFGKLVLTWEGDA